MISTFHQLQEMLETRLKEAGLDEFVDKQRSQFLDLGGEVFVELVLRDASRLEDARKVVDLAAEEMESKGVSVDSVVRGHWEIVSVEYSGHSRTADLTQWRAAAEFKVVLRSGTRQCHVTVDVHLVAIELLEHKVGLRETETSDALPAGHVVREMVAPVVRTFLEQNLSRGGTSYWDPLQDSQLELTSTDMSFLMGQSTAFEELRQAISDSFDHATLDSFLGNLAVSRIKLQDFDSVLPEFSNMLGGAYKRGESFSTSTTDLYGRLDRVEQELLRKYFQGKVNQVKTGSRFGDLVKRYATVF